MSDHSHDPHASQPADAHDFVHEEHGGIAKYIYVFVALCVLTTASFFTYSDAWPWHDTPKVGWLFMMGVSCTKAMLVVLFFMHVKYEASWKYVLTIPASIMSIFLILALVPDVGKRFDTVMGGRTVAEERLKYMAEPRDLERLEELSH
jgi:cytochrome c oxidase subunit 4